MLQRYTHSSVPQNNVINKKPLKTPSATNCLITTYRPFYIASLLAYFAEKMYLCSVDISVGNGASRYQLGVLCDWCMLVVRLFFAFKAKNNRTTTEEQLNISNS
jgi:hypothetical protein